MKILAINGSHRKGNLDFMLGVLVNNLGKYAEIVSLREKNIKFCGAGDNCCPKTQKCGIKDDMAEICTKLEQADMVILASPTYFSNVSARMKNFIDRCNPYWFNKKLKGKKSFLIGTGGYEKSTKDMLKIMEKFTKILGMTPAGSYYTLSQKKGEANNSKVIKELRDIANKLCKKNG